LTDRNIEVDLASKGSNWVHTPSRSEEEFEEDYSGSAGSYG
jgi:hypothetical protein